MTFRPLKIQQWIDENNAFFFLLKSQLGIDVKLHEDGRAIFNYSMIDSPKTNPIVQECRGLVLDSEYNVVAKSFNRFFNAGECKNTANEFVWENSRAYHKEDGSLALLYYYQGKWRVNTRNSFCDNIVAEAAQYPTRLTSDITWEDLFYLGFGDKSKLSSLDTTLTYVFELCSPFNTIVRNYPEPQVFLLSVFNNQTTYELTHEAVDDIAKLINVSRPESFLITDIFECWNYIQSYAKNNPTFEGLVVRDISNRRMKLKSEKYLALHHAYSNGNILLPKNIIPIILKGEQDEILAYFPQSRDVISHYETLINQARTNLDNVWFTHGDEPNRKKFALLISKEKHQWALFEAKSTGKHPVDIFNSNTDRVIKDFLER